MSSGEGASDRSPQSDWSRRGDLFEQACLVPVEEREAWVRANASNPDDVREVLELVAIHEAGPAKGTGGFAPDVLGEALGEAVAAVAPASPAAGFEGRVLAGKYRLETHLGTGGMGSVYGATHVHNGRRVAVKILHAPVFGWGDARDRFDREARVLAAIAHPNVVEIYDSGEDDDGSTYLVMPLLSGRTLRELLTAEGPVPPPEAARIACAVLEALSVAHERQIVHRDVKPPNIFLVGEGPRPAVKVLDFGIAKFLDRENGEATLTRDGQLVGTPRYMSPEQVRGERVDLRADLYSVGAVLYEMLSGQPVVDAANFLEAVRVVQTSEPAALSRVAPGVGGDLARVCRRLLEKRAADRYGSALEAARAIARAAGVREGFGGDWSAAGRFELDPSRKRRLRRAALSATAAGVAVLAVVQVLTFLGVTSGADVRVAAAVAFRPPDDGFVYIPGGAARIGLDPSHLVDGAEADETPAHTVVLEAYHLATHEVTCAEYAEFVRATGRAAPDGWVGGQPRAGTLELPVTGVSWDDAVAYAAWRGERDGEVYRLPSEAEWEWAARGPDGRMYPWGDDWIPDNVYAAREGADSAMPVGADPTGTRDRSPFGVFGMAGNVSEWTSDSFRLYPQSSYRPDAGALSSRIVRGGRYNSIPSTCRTTCRLWVSPETRDKRIGFRLAREVRESS